MTPSEVTVMARTALRTKARQATASGVILVYDYLHLDIKT